MPIFWGYLLFICLRLANGGQHLKEQLLQVVNSYYPVAAEEFIGIVVCVKRY